MGGLVECLSLALNESKLNRIEFHFDNMGANGVVWFSSSSTSQPIFPENCYLIILDFPEILQKLSSDDQMHIVC